MKCPHLMKWVTFLCKADQEVYSPSLFQIEEYCRSTAHKKCPFFLGISDKNPDGSHLAAIL